MEYYNFEEICTKQAWNMLTPHSHKHYELYFLLDGTRTFYINKKVYLIKKHHVALIPPMVAHKTEGGCFSRINISFSRSFVSFFDDDFLSRLFKHEVLVLDENNFNCICDILNMMRIENESKDDMIKIKLFELLMRLNRACASSLAAMQYKSVLIYNVIQRIENDFNDCSLVNLAEEFYVSREHLSREFVKYTGQNLSHYVLNKKFEKAIELLGNTSFSIGKIADICGFSSANYFSLMFKKHIGVSPYGYRKQSKGAIPPK